MGKAKAGAVAGEAPKGRRSVPVDTRPWGDEAAGPQPARPAPGDARQRFSHQCEAAGLEVGPCQLKSGYAGPGVFCESQADVARVTRATTVRVAWAAVPDGFVVYPKG